MGISVGEMQIRWEELRGAQKRDFPKDPEEQDDEEELCELRYEALRSKTKRLMSDLRAERRRLKRERVRAIISIRRAKGISVDEASLSKLVSESSGSSSSEASTPINIDEETVKINLKTM